MPKTKKDTSLEPKLPKRALYRRYRPLKLSDLVGQDAIVQSLTGALKRHTFANAYLFVGPRGTGKTSAARILAHAVNDFDYQLEDERLDIIEIDAASNTGVDSIRSLRENAMIAPSVGKYKVYIIDEVHMLSRSAFPALLKLIEEPPAHVIFIMATTEAHKVPATIVSRSQKFIFKLADADTMKKHLQAVAQKEDIKINSEALDIIVRRGGGSFRDSLSLLDQISTLSNGEINAELVHEVLGLPSDLVVKDLLQAFLAGDSNTITKRLKDSASSGLRPETIADELIERALATSDSRFVPLLASLIEVKRSDYPAAKLLLAFLTQLPQIKTPSLPKVQLLSSQAMPKIAPVLSPAQTVVAPAPSSPKETTPAHTCIQITGNETADWDSLVAAVGEKNAGLKGLLNNVHYRFSKTSLTIYEPNTFVRKKIATFRGLILSFLPTYFELTLSDKPLLSSSTLDDIAQIMGGGEEVNLDA